MVMGWMAQQIASDLPAMRANAEALMLDRVRVWRDAPAEAEPVSDAWGTITPPAPTLVYEGPAKAQNDRTYPSTPDVAGVARIAVMISAVHFPHGTTAVQSGDVCEWTSSPNPRLIGQKVRLRVDEDKTWQTAARFNVAEVVQ